MVVVVVVIFLTAETALRVETPLTTPVLIGRPPLVVGRYEGSGVMDGLGVTEGVGEILGTIEGLALGIGFNLDIKLVVALKV